MSYHQGEIPESSHIYSKIIERAQALCLTYSYILCDLPNINVWVLRSH